MEKQVTETSVTSLKDVDSKIVQAAQKKLEEITGKTYTFSKNEPWSIREDSGWSFEVQGLEHSQVMVKKTGEVQNVFLDVKWNDLKDSLKQEMKAALQQVFPGSNLQVDEVNLSVQYGDFPANHPIKNGAVYMHADIDKTSITLENGKLITIFKSLTPEEVDKAALKAAEGVFVGLNSLGLQKKPLKTSSLTVKDGKEIYTFTFSDSDTESPVFIVVEKGTNKIMNIQARGLEDTTAEYATVRDKLEGYSEQQLLKQATVQAKQLLSMDLTGYKVSKAPQMLNAVYFTKKGTPTLVGQYNSKGQFYVLGFKE
ncbi:hypothetical protein [Aneurinibacillus migulanus]|uniref:hypothetical protein n=1 Tax=Aneurinibacillus migulanus TaxID=47500 RepID=UPI00128F43CF|nr:hypothetical protein [Aneurinibacillus migulanus]